MTFTQPDLQCKNAQMSSKNLAQNKFGEFASLAKDKKTESEPSVMFLFLICQKQPFFSDYLPEFPAVVVERISCHNCSCPNYQHLQLFKNASAHKNMQDDKRNLSCCLGNSFYFPAHSCREYDVVACQAYSYVGDNTVPHKKYKN